MDHNPPFSPAPQALVRIGTPADAATLDAWLALRAPLPVPEARARALSLEALLAQAGQGICLIAGDGASAEGGTAMVRALLPVTLIHSLSTGGRVALATEWWTSPEDDGAAWLAACSDVLADWCRAHGIRHAMLAPGLVAHGAAMPPGFAVAPDGLLHRSLVPSAKRLG